MVPFLTLCLTSWLTATSASARPNKNAENKINDSTAPRNVRVMIVDSTQPIHVRSDNPLIFESDDNRTIITNKSDEWIVLKSVADSRIHWDENVPPTKSLTIHNQQDGLISLAIGDDKSVEPPRNYPGTLYCTCHDSGAIRCVNSLEVEAYVASVVASEAWPTFEPSVFRAQAIAARSFVLYQMTRRNNAAYDVWATQSSQVYRGVRTDTVGKKAQQATNQTHGIVSTWNDEHGKRIFPTYYSAVCGGMSQSAAIFGIESDVPPLAGNIKCNYCSIAPGQTYRWGPVHFNKSTVHKKLKTRFPKMSTIRHIEPSARASSGHITKLRIVDINNKTFIIDGERFRQTIDPNTIRSARCNITIEGDKVIFSDGRGFGHGLGLCQWGSQGLAKTGKSTGEILRYYYPGSELTRVY